MNCKEAGTKIVPFIKDEISNTDLDDFMMHIRHCPDCREELEIYYTVQVGIENLDSDRFDTYNLKGLFEEELKYVSSYLKWNRMFNTVRDALSIFAFMGVIMASILQFLEWF